MNVLLWQFLNTFGRDISEFLGASIKGTAHWKEGIFTIMINEDGIIFHRFFTPIK